MKTKEKNNSCIEKDVIDSVFSFPKRNNSIFIRGAKEHNLKNIDVVIPRDKFVVITGLSGSGKSSLAFDTIYAEGQRRYVESLSSYARQFLGQMEKPNVDHIEGLSPAISIDQKSTSKNPRSTVGTITEIYDYLRLLFANIGIPHCPVCNKVISRQTTDQIVDKILSLPEKTKIQVLAPVIRGQKGEHLKVLQNAKKSGFVRIRIDGSLYELSEEISLDKNKKHSIEIVVDRLIVKDSILSRLTDSVETALSISSGFAIVDVDGKKDLLFSQLYSCPQHDTNIEPLSPRMFSFNNPFGACKKCTGLGFFAKINPDLLIPDRSLSINEGGIKGSGWAMDGNSIASMYFKALSKKYNFSLDTPIKNLSDKILNILLYGNNNELLTLSKQSAYETVKYHRSFEGIINNLERRFHDTQSSWVKEEISSFMTAIPCDECSGKRLSKESLSVTINNTNISDLCDLPVSSVLSFIKNLTLSEKEFLIAESILKEIRNRLSFLVNVGLSYLSLSRSAASLSGGEGRRIRLATQIGSALTGVLYVLDEPSVGLHQHDNDKLLDTLKKLRDLGNTVLVVEHDEDTIYAADHIVDVGPGAGVHGGNIVCQGDIEDIKACKESITGNYLCGFKKIDIPPTVRRKNNKKLQIIGAVENNLKNISVDIPLEKFVCITGVSGSGKSSLINEILYKKLAIVFNKSKHGCGLHKKILGTELLDKVININQSPIGRNPRSNPSTYIGVFSSIRELFASTVEAKTRGFSSSRFSFNIKGGRCEACQGAGVIKIEMYFLPDVYVPCDVCKGQRYSRETLEIKYKDKNIFDVLEMTVEEGVSFFANIPKIAPKLKALCEVGLGYIKIGQPATSLSGGEAQRVKLASELSKRSTGKTIYILDEPTTGLHIADIHRLVLVLQKLVDAGNSVVVIEHNLELIKTADHIIDLGPGGGDDGGLVVATGSPKQVSENDNSITGRYLKKFFPQTS